MASWYCVEQDFDGLVFRTAERPPRAAEGVRSPLGKLKCWSVEYPQYDQSAIMDNRLSALQHLALFNFPQANRSRRYQDFLRLLLTNKGSEVICTSILGDRPRACGTISLWSRRRVRWFAQRLREMCFHF